METCSRFSVVVAFCCGVAIWESDAVAQHRPIVSATDETVQAPLEALRASQALIAAQSCFHCTYTLRYSARRISQVETEEKSDKPRLITGQYSKRLHLKRISRFYDVPADDTSADPPLKSQGFMEVKDLPEDSLIGESSYLSYNPAWRGGFNSAALSRFADNPSQMQAGGCTALERQISPLNGLAGCRRDLFCGEMQDGTVIDYSVATEGDTITVTTRRVKPFEGAVGEVTCVTKLWTKPEVPVVRSIEILQQKKSGAEHAELSREIVQWNDFKQCGKFLIAATVNREVRQPHGISMFSEWRSTDLGEREPQDEDFIIRIEDTTSLLGFHRGVVKPGQLELGPECLADEAIVKPETPDAMIMNPQPQAAVKKKSRLSWFVIVNITGGIILSVFLLRRRPQS